MATMTKRAWRVAAFIAISWGAAGACRPQSEPELGAGSGRATSERSTLPSVVLTAGDSRIGVTGRAVTDGTRLEFGFPGVTTRVCLRGERLWMTASSSHGRSHLGVVHQGRKVFELVVPAVESELLVWEAPPSSSVQEHCVDIVHLTETWLGVVKMTAFRVEGEPVVPAAFPSRRLLFIGDSVTCGEAVRRKPECSKDESWWDAYEAYGPIAARTLEAQYQLVCFGGRGVLRDWQGKTDVLNAPEFFPLAIPDERRLPFSLESYVPDGILLSLGTNDFNPALGAFPPRGEFVAKYVAFVRTLMATYPSARIWLTEGAIVSDENVAAAPKGSTGAGPKQKATLRAYLADVVAEVAAPRVRHLPATHYPADTCDPHPLASEHVRMAADVVSGIRAELGW